MQSVYSVLMRICAIANIIRVDILSFDDKMDYLLRQFEKCELYDGSSYQISTVLMSLLNSAIVMKRGSVNNAEPDLQDVAALRELRHSWQNAVKFVCSQIEIVAKLDPKSDDEKDSLLASGIDKEDPKQVNRLLKSQNRLNNWVTNEKQSQMMKNHQEKELIEALGGLLDRGTFFQGLPNQSRLLADILNDDFHQQI